MIAVVTVVDFACLGEVAESSVVVVDAVVDYSDVVEEHCAVLVEVLILCDFDSAHIVVHCHVFKAEFFECRSEGDVAVDEVFVVFF